MPPNIQTVAALLRRHIPAAQLEANLIKSTSLDIDAMAVMNDVVVTPCTPHNLNDFVSVAQVVATALAESQFEGSARRLVMGTLDFSCAHPMPIQLRPGSAFQCTLSTRVQKQTSRGLHLQFVAREAEHGRHIFSGLQSFTFASK